MKNPQIEIIIDGANFSTIDEFYDEVEKKFTKNLSWKIGRNLDAFNDVLSGGFGVFEREPIIIKWKNSAKSRNDFGYMATIKYYEEVKKYCHISAIDKINKKIALAKSQEGETLFHLIIEIIQNKERDNKITLFLE